ncbi:MAG: hypothetical protein KAQ68_05145, partial [Clostridiales bacterium]|nr:hypothetical protein [Clostridiales bacterium]
MSQQRRTYIRQANYQPYVKPYYTKKKPQIVLLELLLLVVISICLITAASPHIELLAISDVYPNLQELPPLVPEDAEEENAWVKNLVPPIENTIYMAWDEDPFGNIPPGVNVLAPIWFYIKADPLTGAAVVKNLLQLGDTDWNPQQYVERCHANGVKVWGTVFSTSDPSLAEQIVTNQEIQDQVIGQLVAWTRAYNLDGISLDFEKMDPENKDLFTAFAKNLKDALPVNQDTVSVAVTVKLLNQNGSNWYQCYDRGGLAEVIDYVAVMTYEGHKSGSGLVPVAGIDWVETHILRILEEVPSDKLIMGVPFYGVDYISKVNDSDSFDITPLWQDDKAYRINFFSSELSSALANGEYVKRGKLVTVNYWLDKGSWNDTLGVSQYAFVDMENMLHNIFID